MLKEHLYQEKKSMGYDDGGQEEMRAQYSDTYAFD
jgi:hypothetical protein